VTAAAFLVAIAVRVVLALTDDALPTKDARDYDQLAVAVASGRGMVDARGEPTAYRPPLYPLTLAAVYRLVGHDYRAVRLFQALVGAVTVLVIAAWARRIAGDRAAAMAAVVAALYVPFFGYWFGSTGLTTETLFTLLLGLALLSLRVWVDAPRPPLAILSGALWGLAILCRGVALPLLLALPAALLALGFGRRSALRYGAVALPAAALVMVPWIARNYHVFDRLVPLSTNGGGSFYASNHRGSDGFGTEFYGRVVIPEDERLRRLGWSEPERSSYFFGRGLEFIRGHPAEAGRLWLWKAALYLDPFHLTYQKGLPAQRIVNSPYVLVALGSAWAFLQALATGRHRRDVYLLAFVFGFLLVFHAVFHSAHRYRLPSEPVLIVLTAAALDGAWRNRRSVTPDTPAGPPVG